MTDDVWVELTASEVAVGAMAGVMRYVESLSSRRSDGHGLDPDKVSGVSLHIEGACGEMAFAKWRGRYWSAGLNTFKAGDVGAVQVRTRSRHDYDLIVRDDDADDVFVLVTGLCPKYCIRGWIRGAEAKSDEFLASHGGRPPAYFVPQARLRALPRQPTLP